MAIGLGPGCVTHPLCDVLDRIIVVAAKRAGGRQANGHRQWRQTGGVQIVMAMSHAGITAFRESGFRGTSQAGSHCAGFRVGPLAPRGALVGARLRTFHAHTRTER